MLQVRVKKMIKKFFKKLIEMIDKEIKVLDENLELAYDTKFKWSEREKWDLETGKKFNELVSNYPISEDELLEMSKVLCEFVMQTRVTDIEEYFFVNRDRDRVRLPFMLGDAYDIGEIISELKGEMNIDEKGNNVLNGGTEEYEQKWKYEIGENYGLNKAIKIIKKHCYK